MDWLSENFLPLNYIYIGYAVRLETHFSEFDSPEDRYQKVKEIVQKYTAIQFGICPFFWNEQS